MKTAEIKALNDRCKKLLEKQRAHAILIPAAVKISDFAKQIKAIETLLARQAEVLEYMQEMAPNSHALRKIRAILYPENE